ncbi:sigma-70 family RNA polymerase sigma factor [Paenibacillus nanensis]|uniref:Sigma-70 family RNA polymerase sigma factor n=2 Tax=Paenibacillus nanensis TaxID=393251 RepID=A0A3A1UWA7_9BACL|nr:sigma-70 family RNA polymerase sigma factor [Paenibacillus nanensis]
MASVLREMCEGSSVAFDQFYTRYAPLVLRVALRMLGDRMEAEDVCHDIFLEALRKGDRYEPAKGSIEAWLAVMTKSRCLDRLRKKQRTVASGGAEHGELLIETTPEDKAIGLMERLAVREALDDLPLPQRNAVVTAYFGDKSQRELAEEWQVPLGTVKSWIRYGIGNLRKGLAKRGWASDNGGRRESEW